MKTNKTLLCAGLCLTCKERSVKDNDNFERKAVCLKKFWQDKPFYLSLDKPITKCDDYKAITSCEDYNKPLKTN